MATSTYSYALVGSFYDKATKNYHNQESIVLDNVSLDSLENIDLFTTGLSYANFYKGLPKHYQEKNQFSIRVTNNRTGAQHFLRTIFSQPQLHDALQEVRSKTVLLVDRGYQTLSLLPLSSFIENHWKDICQLLQQKDEDKLATYFGRNSSYLFKLQRYMNSSFDEGYESEVLRTLCIEFRDYPVFRKFFLESNKKTGTFYMNTPKDTLIYKQPMVLKPAEFGKDYIQNQVNSYNNLGEKEEFLTAEEILEFHPFTDTGDSFFPSLAKKAKSKKKRDSHDEY